MLGEQDVVDQWDKAAAPAAMRHVHGDPESVR